MMFLWILLLIIALVAVWFLMRDQNGKLPWENKPEGPLDILKRRFAEGAISREEYEEKKKMLEEDE